MEKKNENKMFFTYSIKDKLNNGIISLLFTVDFFEIDNQLYVENGKSRILIEATSVEDGKKSFEEIINRKVRESIMKNNLFDLISNWNLEFKPVAEIIEDKKNEIIDFLEKQEKLNKNQSETISGEIKLDYSGILKYSSAMINNFSENTEWRASL